MTRDDFLKAFFEMSPEDQEAIRSELVGSAARAGPSSCGPGAMKQHMMEMMEKLQASDQPMACCREMMGMCQEMMEKLASRSTT